MKFDQQRILQKLAEAQSQQAPVSEPVKEDWQQLHREAEALIAEIGQEQDPESLDDMEAFWGQALAAFGEDWENLLDEVHEEAEAAREEGRPYHHSGQMYWRILDRCYGCLQEEELPFHQNLFRECLGCLRATRTLQESLAREAAEKRSFGAAGL